MPVAESKASNDAESLKSGNSVRIGPADGERAPVPKTDNTAGGNAGKGTRRLWRRRPGAKGSEDVATSDMSIKGGDCKCRRRQNQTGEIPDTQSLEPKRPGMGCCNGLY
jgi:hypothetical protein